MSWLGTHIRHLTITLHCYRSGSESNFALDCPSLRYETQRDLARSIDRITGLREFKFEVTWHPNNSTAVLLPAQREVMLGQIRDVAIGDRGAWEGWLDECKVRDATRWKVRWSGVVWMRRRDGLDAMG